MNIPHLFNGLPLVAIKDFKVLLVEIMTIFRTDFHRTYVLGSDH